MRHRFRLIMGRHCIEEVARLTPTRLVNVYTAIKDSRDPLLTLLAQKGVSLRSTSKEKLTQMVQSDSHQSFVAEVKERGKGDFTTLLQWAETTERGFLLLLDSIFDPHNIGAILRAAECFGVDGVIYSKNRGGDITPVVSKVSSGATELIESYRVANLAETVNRLKECGFSVVAAEAGIGTISLNEFSFPEKTLLLMGSEGKGLQPLLQKKTDFPVTIPMYGKIDSLNVSQATAVFLARWRQQSPLSSHH